MYVMRSCVTCYFFFSSRRRHTRLQGDWSSDVCSSDLDACKGEPERHARGTVERERRRGADVDAVGEGQHERGCEPKHADRDFEPAIECRRSLMAVGAAAEQPGARAPAPPQIGRAAWRGRE